MNEYTKLKQYLTEIGGVKDITLCQGIVKSVDGCRCDVQIGDIVIPDVRLRASETDDDTQTLITPKTGSAVIVGSLSGDMTRMVVLQVDSVESIVVNGGKLGGLVNIEQLTARLNAIEDDVNALKNAIGEWTPLPQDGGAALKGTVTTWAQQKLTKSRRNDYEDETIKH